MLKQLIQLFAEKFLVSKKEWVSNQSFCGNNYVELPVSLGSFTSYTAPTDGVLFVSGEKATGVDIIADDTRLRINISRATAQVVAGFIPLSKGQKVGYALFGETDPQSRVRFIRSIGS